MPIDVIEQQFNTFKLNFLILYFEVLPHRNYEQAFLSYKILTRVASSNMVKITTWLRFTLRKISD